MANTKTPAGPFLMCCMISEYIYCLIILVGGLGLLGVGMWMGIDKDVQAYFIVFRRNPGDDLLVAGFACFIVVGILLVGIGVLGWIGTMKRNALFLMLFIGLLVIVFIIEVTVGFCVLTFRDEIHRYVKNGMKEQLMHHYEWDNKVGKGWNRIQVRHRCCGADGSWDYTGSDWFYGQSGNVGISDPNDASVFVPDSCCVLEYNQDRDPGKVDPQNPTPKDERRCNEDAAGRKNDDNYLHGRGCYAALQDFIFIHLYLIMGGSIAFGLMQIFGIAITLVLIVAIRGNSDPLLDEKY